MTLGAFDFEPSYASRIAGLGGRQAPPDPAYAFQTTPLVAPAGSLEIAIAFDLLMATRGTLLIEIVEGKDSERRQVSLRTVALKELAAKGGTEYISIISDRRAIYSVAGSIHDDTDASAASLMIQISEVRPADGSVGPSLPETMARVPRLAGTALPSFVHPTSQTWSREQQNEPAYHLACRTLGLEVSAASWPAAYTYQALRYLLGNLSGCSSIGVTTSSGALMESIRFQGAASVVSGSIDPALWPPVTNLDFAWFVSEGQAEDPRILLWTALAMIDRLRPGGGFGNGSSFRARPDVARTLRDFHTQRRRDPGVEDSCSGSRCGSNEVSTG